MLQISHQVLQEHAVQPINEAMLNKGAQIYGLSRTDADGAEPKDI